MELKISRLIPIFLIFIVLLVVIASIISISGQTRTALERSNQEKLMYIAGAVAVQVDGDSFARIQIGDENTTNFIQLRDQLKKTETSLPEINSIYTMRKVGNTVEFVVDADYGYASDAAQIGEPYPQAEPELLSGFNGPSVDKEFTTDQWGTVLSGFSPIRDHNGTVVGIVGVDMASNDVIADINRINWSLYLVGMITIIFIILGIVVVERRLMIDEEKIGESEKKYRTLFERAGVGIFLLDTEGGSLGKIIDVNEIAAVMHGYSKDELEKLHITDLVTPDIKFKGGKWLRQILEGRVLHTEHNHRKKDGTMFPVEVSGSLVDLGKKKYIISIDRDISERKRASEAIQNATKKLNFLNSIVFTDIQNAVFTFRGYFELEKTSPDVVNTEKYWDRELLSIQKIQYLLDFSKYYRDLGVNPPKWQNVNQVFLFAISHLDFSSIGRDINLDDLEIYADSLLEQVFVTLADNVLKHGKNADHINFNYREISDGLILTFEDNGVGIMDARKEAIFTRGTELHGMGLFLAREILGITNIVIKESGIYGKGARFEMFVPRGLYRFSDKT